MDERVGIIGAGPAGLSAAYNLAKRGVPVDVFEARREAGGMCQTIKLWDQKVDLGPHRFFSADPRVNRLWLEVAAGDYSMIKRKTRILYQKRLFNYPLQISDSLAKLGFTEAICCCLSYLRQQFRPDRAENSFEEWVRNRFGHRLYEIFFRSYSEKLWGISCVDLDAEFAAQRIRKLSLFEAVRNALSEGRGNSHPTLVDRFAYPVGGTGSIYDRMAAAISGDSGSVQLHTPVQRIVPRPDGRIDLVLPSGDRRTYLHIVTTMPLTHLVRSLPDAPPKVLDACMNLRFRNTILVYVRVEGRDLFQDQWIYVHDSGMAVGRITNFRNWVPELTAGSDDTILSLELWCNPGDAQWLKPPEQHIERAISDLRRTGLIGNASILGGHVEKIPFCYPVYHLGYRSHLSIVRDYLRSIPGLVIIGRCGSFKYNNQDHSLLMGILAAENIALGREHDLWEVNADTAYQERCVIDETGLVPQLS